MLAVPQHVILNHQYRSPFPLGEINEPSIYCVVCQLGDAVFMRYICSLSSFTLVVVVVVGGGISDLQAAATEMASPHISVDTSVDFGCCCGCFGCVNGAMVCVRGLNEV